MTPPNVAAMSRVLRAREAIGSVSLSHAENCRCDICRAALGDEDAFVRVFEELFADA